jgi:hypothetical protein
VFCQNGTSGCSAVNSGLGTDWARRHTKIIVKLSSEYERPMAVVYVLCDLRSCTILIIIIIIYVMELGHLLTGSGLTYPEVSSKVCHDSFCQLENSVSLSWVIYYEAFCLYVVSSFSCTPVICPKLVLHNTDSYSSVGSC